MKKAAAILAICVSLQAVAQVKYTNPILHADWSDPDVCRVGDDYYMTASSFNQFPGLPILHSKDLVNWEQIGAALVDYPGKGWDAPEDDFRTTVQHGNGVWAPAIRYHDGWFYIYCGDPDRGIFMVRTQTPAGTWEDPVWIYKGKGFIDPCPFWDDDGKAYLSHAAAGSRAGLKSIVFVAPLSADGTRLTGPSRMVFDGHEKHPTIEGTKMYKRDGKYYIFCPAGGVKTGWQTVLRADSPFGHYEDRIVMAPGEETINGPHQGAWVDTPSGTDWFIHFQDKGAYGRITHLQPMAWGNDGWPVIGEDPDGDGCGQPVDSWEAPFGLANRQFNQYDWQHRPQSYEPYGLPLEWQYPCVPSPLWHFALPGGGVRLFSVERESGNLWNCRNVLSQKFPAERLKVYARLVFSPHKDLGEQAGMVVTGSDYAAMRISDKGGSANLEYVTCLDADKDSEETVEVLGDLPYADGKAEVWVMVQVYPRMHGEQQEVVARFSYSLDGRTYTKMHSGFVCRPGTWIGSKFGFWCSRAVKKNDGGHLDVLDLRVTRELGDHSTYQYDESKVPEYELPDALTLNDGRKVRSIKDWERKRRPELLKLFEENIYGKAPVGKPSGFHSRVLESGEAFGGLAEHRQVRICFDREETQFMDLLLYVPKGADGPVPAFLGINFAGNHATTADPAVLMPDIARWRRDFILEERGSRTGRWGFEEALKHGYAVATFCCEDVDPDQDDGFRNGVIGYYSKGMRKPDDWGNIAAWAWGLSRVLDYFEEDASVDASRVAVLGHSRFGKTALWAGANDSRFAMVISNASGCGGAAISRRHFGETLRRIGSTFPYWWCDNFLTIGDNEDALPVDQHELLSLIAPRPLYVQSCSEDLWADPYGEYLSLVEAGKVYALYGFEGFADNGLPLPEHPQIIGRCGHHVCTGKHEIRPYDWQQYISFADMFLK